MYLVKTPWLLKKLYPGLVWNVDHNKRCLYLTFDDGPIPIVTPFVLNILKQYNAKATFFCIGDNVRKYPDVFEQVKNDGHAIGNHTYNHLNGWKTDDKTYLDNFLHADKLLDTTLFRPPYGRIKRSQVKLLKEAKPGLRIIMWRVLSGDFDVNLEPEACLKNVMKHTDNGDIVLFHDSLKAKERMEYALPRALELWSKEGFEFCALRLVNAAILDKYKIRFKINKDDNGNREVYLEQVIPSNVNFFLCDYFTWHTMSPAIFEDEILPEIEKAIYGQPFDQDGGGFECFLTIGPEISTLHSTNALLDAVSIPTGDIRDIILLWIDFIKKNNLEKYT